MDVSLLFKIAGIGILVTVIVQMLRQNGREELSMGVDFLSAFCIFES